tara:strand:- start:39 stop:374 length:336 start_codon:yes stop_codon:yes gene_type:complete
MKVDFNKSVYYVYVLLKNKKPTYIGLTTCVKHRISTHKKTKDFDSYFILERTNDKKIAMAVELNLIRYNKAYGNDITNIIGGYRDFMVTANTFNVNDLKAGHYKEETRSDR